MKEKIKLFYYMYKNHSFALRNMIIRNNIKKFVISTSGEDYSVFFNIKDSKMAHIYVSGNVHYSKLK